MRHADSVRLGSALAMTVFIMSLAPIYAADQTGQADTAKEITVTGRIVSVRPAEHQLTLKTTKGKELELNLDSHSHLTHHRQPAKLSEFQEGNRVRATYEPAKGKNRLLSLRDAPVTAEEVQQELRNALDAVKNYTYQQKQEYQKRLEPVLQDLDERIDHLKEQAKGASKEARKWYAQSLQELRRERRTVREQLAKVQAAAPAAWDEIKAGVGAAWTDLRQAFQRANERLKEGNPSDRP
jgi:Cu/Ag efflux protein CusF/archaellum component FlaC